MDGKEPYVSGYITLIDVMDADSQLKNEIPLPFVIPNTVLRRASPWAVYSTEPSSILMKIVSPGSTNPADYVSTRDIGGYERVDDPIEEDTEDEPEDCESCATLDDLLETLLESNCDLNAFSALVDRGIIVPRELPEDIQGGTFYSDNGFSLVYRASSEEGDVSLPIDGYHVFVGDGPDEEINYALVDEAERLLRRDLSDLNLLSALPLILERRGSMICDSGVLTEAPDYQPQVAAPQKYVTSYEGDDEGVIDVHVGPELTVYDGNMLLEQGLFGLDAREDDEDLRLSMHANGIEESNDPEDLEWSVMFDSLGS